MSDIDYKRMAEDNNKIAHAAFQLLADIRAAAGDPEGKLMQDELVEHIAALREDRARLLEAAELGLEYAECALEQQKISLAGYPHRWAQEMHDVAAIQAALDAAKAGGQP